MNPFESQGFENQDGEKESGQQGFEQSLEGVPPMQQDIHQETTDKTPGVYVRNEQPQPQELDMLWGNQKHVPKEDQKPILFFGMGVVVGVIVTGAIFLLFLNKPTATVADNASKLPEVEEIQLVPKIDDPTKEKPVEAAVTTPGETDEMTEAPTPTKPIEKATKLVPKQPAQLAVQYYNVRNGDTLEQIARKYYGKGTPEMIEKIQRANNMRNANRLAIGQKLVIPPKTY